MKYLNKDLKPLAEEQYPNRGPFLFGEGFASKAKATADGIWQQQLKIQVPGLPQPVGRIQPFISEASLQTSWPSYKPQTTAVTTKKFSKNPKQQN